jgi:DNA-directed RNA polymerase subunit RPC12/RpoP
MGQTLVVCEKCSAIFPSPIAFLDRGSYETATLSGNMVNCPKCGSMVPCNKENMIFKE